MKKILLLLFFAALTVTVFCQVVDSTATVTYHFGDSFKTFLEQNLWTFVFTAFFLISEWLGSTGKIKENSIWQVAINFIKKFLQKKAAPLKILIFGLIFSGIAVTASAQDNKWKGFFKPIPEPAMRYMATATPGSESPGKWLFRPAVEISAIQLIYNKEAKAFDTQSLKQGGFGISYQHLALANGEYVMDYGFTGLMLLDMAPTETTRSGFSLAGTVSALRFLNLGGGYNFTLKKPFLLTGVTYNFN